MLTQHTLQIVTSNAFLIAMVGILAAATIKLGPLLMLNLYFMPYWINVVGVREMCIRLAGWKPVHLRLMG